MKEIQENWRNFIIGIGFTFLIAGFGYLIALAPIFNRIGPLASAIILAIIYRQIFGYPEKFKTGIGFSSKYILRLDRKNTRLNSSHVASSYAVFCLKKKNSTTMIGH